MEAYDLDDTLASVDFEQAPVRSLETVYRQAKVLYVPDVAFIVITARPHASAGVRTATADWLKANEPNWTGGIYYCNAGSEQGVIEEKARYIKSNRVTDFTDNNEAILAGLRPLVPGVVLWLIDNGVRSRF
jgi:hypothetical protein